MKKPNIDQRKGVFASGDSRAKHPRPYGKRRANKALRRAFRLNLSQT